MRKAQSILIFGLGMMHLAMAQDKKTGHVGAAGVNKVGLWQESISPVDVKDIGGFWGTRIEKSQQNYLRTFPIDKYVGMVESRNFTAWDWRSGEQPGKWLEGAILTSARTKDLALEKEARDMLDRVIKSQAPDGYIGITSASVRTAEKPLRGMDAYELYFMEHALLTAYEVWHNAAALKAARSLGDYFVNHIGPGKAEFWPSPTHAPENKGKALKGTMHSDIAGHSIHYGWEGTLWIDPMTRLYQLTSDRRYLDWSKWVVSNIDKWSGWDAYSNLDKVAHGEMPIDKIQPYVHAHTFQMNFLGMLRLFRVTGDSSYFKKVVGAWNDIASRQLYITGGVSVGEHYEREYVKPLTGEMMETCATMSWIQLSQELLDLTGDSKYADAIERITLNQAFAEQTIDGDANHYFTPPNGYTPKGYYREADCCMSSGPRLMSLLPGTIYASLGRPGKSGVVYINQFVPSSVGIGGLKIRQETNFPTDSAVVIHVDGAGMATIFVRIPNWCSQPTLTLNGTAVNVTPGTYARLSKKWSNGDRLVLTLPMKLDWVKHDHYQKATDRKPYKTSADNDAPYTLTRGPLVYAVDDIWYKGDTADFGKGWMDSTRYVLTDPAKLKPVAAEPGILGPGYSITLQRQDGHLISLPVYPFANIGKWYRDAAHKPDSNSAAWTYAIWLKGFPDIPERSTGSLSLPYIYGNNMVLQRDRPIPVIGNASPHAQVTVGFGNEEHKQSKTTTADALGHWKVVLDAVPASFKPAVMIVMSTRMATIADVANDPDGSRGVMKDSMTVEQLMLRNILVGETWLCSGQSNMEYAMRKLEKAGGPAESLPKESNPHIRLFLVRNNYSKPDTKNIRRAWDSATGNPLRDFSAAGYYFAKSLYDSLHVPIGMISNAVPGSAIEPFLPSEGNAADSGTGVLAANDKGFTGGKMASGTGKFFTTMVAPLAPYPVKGFLWYQGETNCMLNDTILYPAKMRKLIESWRGLWGDTTAPFYFVQIAPFLYSRSNGGNQVHTVETEADFWGAQEKALALPHTGMVVTSDLVDSISELHPSYKWVIGRRLALWALAKDYHFPVEYSGPVFSSASVRGRAVTLRFDHVGGGLISHNGKPLDWFAVAGADGNFVPADAVISGDMVIVKSSAVRHPVAVRFGWNEGAQPNLFNKEGLPAMPFRTYLP